MIITYNGHFNVSFRYQILASLPLQVPYTVGKTLSPLSDFSVISVRDIHVFISEFLTLLIDSRCSTPRTDRAEGGPRSRLVSLCTAGTLGNSARNPSKKVFVFVFESVFALRTALAGRRPRCP